MENIEKKRLWKCGRDQSICLCVYEKKARCNSPRTKSEKLDNNNNFNFSGNKHTLQCTQQEALLFVIHNQTRNSQIFFFSLRVQNRTTTINITKLRAWLRIAHHPWLPPHVFYCNLNTKTAIKLGAAIRNEIFVRMRRSRCCRRLIADGHDTHLKSTHSNFIVCGHEPKFNSHKSKLNIVRKCNEEGPLHTTSTNRRRTAGAHTQHCGNVVVPKPHAIEVKLNCLRAWQHNAVHGGGIYSRPLSSLCRKIIKIINNILILCVCLCVCVSVSECGHTQWHCDRY